MARKHVFLITLVIDLTILFLSLGFASFSTTLSIDNIEVAIRQEKDIRITNFHPKNNINDNSSYNIDSVHTKIYLPNPDSEVTYTVEVTNISTYALQIENINIYPNNLTYTLSNYELGEYICDNNKLDNECNMGVVKTFDITFKYKENGYDPNNETGEYYLDANFEWSYNYKIVFHSNYQDEELEDEETEQLLPYNTYFPLQLNQFSKPGFVFSKWSTNPNGGGFTYANGRTVKDLVTNGSELHLYAIWKIPQEEIYYEGECIFNGQGNDIEGECSEGKSIDYINTNIVLFNEANYTKNFMISFKITDVPDSRFTAGERDTIFNALYENNDKIAGRYPGIVLRIEGNKWQLQGGNGKVAGTKITFNKADLIGKEFKLFRFNDGETIKLYYSINGNGPFVLADVTTLYGYFDTPLTFGASQEITNEPYRFSTSTVNDIKFSFLDDDITLDEIIAGETHHHTDELQTVFAYNGPCTFNGNNANMTGDSCTDYSSQKFINTNISLFNSTNYQKDFILSFDIDSYTNTQDNNQATLMNAFRERTGLGYGVLLRKNNNALQFIFRDGNGLEKMLTLPTDTTKSLKIIRNDNIACYSLNGGPLTFAISYENFADPFDVPVTFGGAIDKSNNPFRYIKGTLSNMSIQLGEIDDPNLTCPTS